MYYNVKARLKTETAAEFLGKLRDGSIQQQKPDGKEIVDSMNRAVVTDTGDIEWSETCYCETPLLHERTTVYDHYFDNMSTTEVDGFGQHEGTPFMPYLGQLAAGTE